MRDAPELAPLRALIEQVRPLYADVERERMRVRTLVGEERSEALARLEVVDRERRRAEETVERWRSQLTAQGLDVVGLLTGCGSGGGATGGAGGTAGTGGTGATDAGTRSDAAAGGAGGSGVTDPGTEGDGKITIQSPFHPDPAQALRADVPRGQRIDFTMSSSDSMIYPLDTDGNPFTRAGAVYVPAGYVSGTEVPFMVVQDGVGAYSRPAAIRPTPPAYPNGAAEYHEQLIAGTAVKPLRVVLEAGTYDAVTKFGVLVNANDAMFAAPGAKGYHVRYIRATGADHVDLGVLTQTLASNLIWLWRGYPIQ